MKDTVKLTKEFMDQLPAIDCGGCGFKTCEDFASFLPGNPEEIKRCTHVNVNSVGIPESKATSHFVFRNKPGPAVGFDSTGEDPEEDGKWIDNLNRPYDFILDCFENEPGPRETILPYNPLLVKELGVKKGDIMIGRPMGMSCGCPITHCGIVTDTDPRNGVIHWCVTGPLKPRNEGFIDIGYYVAQAYDGLIKEAKEEIRIGKRYWFLPRRCMLQWRHSGLVNSVTRLKDGGYKVRIEGLFIG